MRGSGDDTKWLAMKKLQTTRLATLVVAGGIYVWRQATAKSTSPDTVKTMAKEVVSLAEVFVSEADAAKLFDDPRDE